MDSFAIPSTTQGMIVPSNGISSMIGSKRTRLAEWCTDICRKIPRAIRKDLKITVTLTLPRTDDSMGQVFYVNTVPEFIPKYEPKTIGFDYLVAIANTEFKAMVRTYDENTGKHFEREQLFQEYPVQIEPDEHLQKIMRLLAEANNTTATPSPDISKAVSPAQVAHPSATDEPKAESKKEKPKAKKPKAKKPEKKDELVQ